jgi:class 3 adenylate cyclase
MHPWPSQHGDGKRIEYLWRFESSASPEDVWRVLSDTSRMNRALGGPEMHFTEVDGKLHGWSKNGGFRHEWREQPWSWVAGHWLEGIRVYDKGFMKVMHSVHRIDERPGGGSVVHVSFAFLPSGAFGATMIKLGFPSLEKGYKKVIDEIRGVERPPSLVAAAEGLAPDAAARLDGLRQQLKGERLDGAIVDKLIDWVRTGDEQDLARIQVRERARAWGVDEDRLLSVFLHATRAGLLELSWDVVCPHCRGVREEHGRVDEIPRGVVCTVCAIDFETDDAVEITFHVHPSVRVIEKRMFCAAEPATKAHVRVQIIVGAGGEQHVEAKLTPGRWRMRLHGAKQYGYLDAGAAPGGDVTWKASDEPRVVAVGAAPALHLVNDGAAPTAFVVEAAQWSDSALRPGRLLSFQEFRDLFSEEYLGSDVQLSVGEQTILFTDMVGSTALYAHRGDPGAFVEVKKHFDQVFAIIGKLRGAVVKTIGDAAMGAFNDPLDAVRASKEIHDTFPPGRDDTPAVLRISLNTGPCIAVRLNANIDYFGGTVNVAAKLQALAESWQIAMTKKTWESPGVAAWIAAQGGEVVDLAYTSKALPEAVPVKQWTVHAPKR